MTFSMYSMAGLFISVLVHLGYRRALAFEEPFTNIIYSAKSKSKKK